MIQTIGAFNLYDHPGTPIIDVRSPAEYLNGHIPNAVNVPIFDDEERALVGTRYNQAGKDAGFLLGLEITGPKLAGYVKKLNGMFPVHSPLIVYCWRGGLRSNAMAWLFDKAGHDVSLLHGGYKAFRGFIREQITYAWQFRIIGGMTGSGKTDTLRYLSEMGEQVVDLEALACHKGSVFGHLGQEEQPTNENFENELWEKLRQLDPLKPVYLEDESRSIGKVSLPDSLYVRMQLSPLFLLEVAPGDRIKRLVEEYGCYTSEELIENIQKLAKYIGGDVHKLIITAVQNSDLPKATELLLNYYDKKYSESIMRVKDRYIIPVEGCTGDSRLNAGLILQKKSAIIE